MSFSTVNIITIPTAQQVPSVIPCVLTNDGLVFAGTRLDEAVQDSGQRFRQLPDDPGGPLPEGRAIPQQPPRC